MKKQLNTEGITNELAGASLFFSQQKRTGQKPVSGTPLPEKPVRQEEQGKKEKQHLTPLPAPHADAQKRPVKPRHGFDIYWDQYEALVKWSNEEKLQGGTGSMSRMVREALDDYIAKRKKQ
jgi:hypothetical protein